MLQLLSSGSTEPVSLAEAKAHLRVTISNDDTYISALVTAARQLVESETDTALVTQTWLESLQNFPDRNTLYYGLNLYYYWQLYKRKLKLSKWPVTAVSSVQYYDASNTLQTMTVDTDYYLSMPTNNVAWLEPTIYWPITFVRPDAVQVTYSVLNTAQTELAKHAIKLLVGTWYESREAENLNAVPSSLQLGLDRILRQIDRRGYV